MRFFCSTSSLALLAGCILLVYCATLVWFLCLSIEKKKIEQKVVQGKLANDL